MDAIIFQGSAKLITNPFFVVIIIVVITGALKYRQSKDIFDVFFFLISKEILIILAIIAVLAFVFRLIISFLNIL